MEGMAHVLQECDEFFIVFPLQDDDLEVDSTVIFPRLDVIANGISEDGEIPDVISEEQAILLGQLAIMPDYS
jgi:hypothetical protein